MKLAILFLFYTIMTKIDEFIHSFDYFEINDTDNDIRFRFCQWSWGKLIDTIDNINEEYSNESST